LTLVECGRVIEVLNVEGKRIRIRTACKRDREKLIKFYESLSTETIYNRFMGIIRYFDPYVDDLLKRYKSIVIVAEDEETGDIVGVSEAVGDEKGSAESGIAVLERYQRKGIGTALAKAIVEESRRAGFKTLYGYILSENIGAYKLAKKFGAKIKRSYGTMTRIEIPLY
jgi:GNAT superfamily N-acetyltransferase